MNTIAGSQDTEAGRLVGAWFASIVGGSHSGPYWIIGWAQDGQLKAAALFDDYKGYGANIELHFVGQLSRQVMREIARYAFLVAKCGRLTAKPYRSNKKLRAALLEIGFSFESVQARYYGKTKSCDAIVYRMFRKDAEKWM